MAVHILLWEALDEANARLARLVAESAPADEISHAKTSRLYASITHFYAGEVRGNVDGRLPIELQGLRVDDVAFVAVPAEVFVEIGLRIKQAARHPVFLVGIANGYIGYLPTRAAYEAGGYEVVSAKCDAGSEDVLVNEALALGDRLLAPTTAR